MNLDTLIGELHEKTKKFEHYHKPEIYRLTKKQDKISLFEILSKNQNIQIFDDLDNQLKELIKSIYPNRKFDTEEIKTAIKEHKGDTPHNEYGVWVFYPWSEKLVHILDKEEFIFLRTARNKFKITEKEQDLLQSKKIGVIGLSVGQSVSITLAMERSCGELRIADFDNLELSNLNRLKTGIHNLNLPKVAIVAREIAEIDPFLNVVCYFEGINDDNINDFLTKGGKLDVLIDECDSLDIKVKCRQEAKKLQIPVLMEASDRGTIDIERFDLEPDRSILHGLIDHLDTSKLKDLKTNEDKVPYILPIAGIETISDRLKASMVEVGELITTWPQLASAVTLGGGVTADVARRLMLDQLHISGRFFIDIEDLIADEKKQDPNTNFSKKIEEITLRENDWSELRKVGVEILDNIKHEKIKGQVSLPTEKLNKIVEAGIAAPSGGNSQPWKLVYKDDALFILIDKKRSLNMLDYKNYASMIAFGALAENIRLEAEAQGYSIQTEEVLGKNAQVPELIATIRFYQAEENYNKEYEDLHPFVYSRTTNRNISEPQPLDTAYINEIYQIATESKGKLQVITDREDIEKIAEVVSETERLRLRDPWGHFDLMSEIRWDTETAIRTKDGIDLRTVDLSPSEYAGFMISKKWNVIDHINSWHGGAAFKKLAIKTVMSASAMALLTMPGEGPEAYFQGGKALQRIWMHSTRNKVGMHPHSPVTFLMERAISGNGLGMSELMQTGIIELKKEFDAIFTVDEGNRPIFLFKLSRSKEAEVKSLRRSIKDVIEIAR